MFAALSRFRYITAVIAGIGFLANQSYTNSSYVCLGTSL